MKTLALLLAFCIAFTALVTGQSSIKYIGIEQGLSNNAVTTIYRDQNGFMWFGTYDGLNRYDGYGFTVFRNRIGDTTSLINNNVFAIDGDSRHNLWIGGEKGACLYNAIRSGFSPLRYVDSKSKKLLPVQQTVYAIRALPAGPVLVGTEHNGLLEFAGDENHGREMPLPSGSTQYTAQVILYNAAQRITYVFVQQHGLYLYEPAAKNLIPVSGQVKQANCMALAGDGSVWVGSNDGVYKYDPQTRLWKEGFFPYSSKIMHLTVDRKNTVWIATNGSGVWQLPTAAAVAVPFVGENDESLVNSNAINDIYEDAEGRKWIGTLRGGVNIIEPATTPFKLIAKPYTSPQHMVSNFILTFCEDREHNIWIGTDGAGLRYWNRKDGSMTDFVMKPGDPQSISSNFVTGLAEDNNGDIWISTWIGGINRFNRSSRTFDRFVCFNPYSNAAENNTWTVYRDKQQRLWASATNDGSLYLFDRAANRFELFDPQISNLQSLYEDAAGNFWGGNYSSLIRIDRINKQHKAFPLETTVRCIYEDTKKNFWLGTQANGLLLFDRATGRYQRYTVADGLPSNIILRILEDKQGYLWLSTFNGLSRFDPVGKTFQNFTQSDGLQSNQFGFNAGLALQSGEFLFGGIRGFNIFFPDSVYKGSKEEKLFLTAVRVDNTSIYDKPGYITSFQLDQIRKITLPYNDAVLSLDFLTPAFSGTDKIEYAYYLEGWDKDWIFSNSVRTANYSRLQEGSYTFKVKVRGTDGKWHAETTLLDVVILPPWFRTGWAYLLYILAAAAAIYLYMRYTKRQERLRYEVKLAHIETEKEKEMNEKKLDYFTHISHEFRSPLSLIINPIRKMQNEGEPGTEHKSELNIVYRNARRLLSLVDQLLLFRKADSGADTLKKSKVDIAALCRDVFQCFTQQARINNITYLFEKNTTGDQVFLFLDREKTEIALFNLLSNAFKFTPAGGSISVDLSEQEDTIELAVKDTGSGINEKDKLAIFDKFSQPGKKGSAGFGIGLYLVKHFITAHQGTVDCQSIIGKGTTFTISLPKTMQAAADEEINEAQVSAGLLAELIEEEVVDVKGEEMVKNTAEGKIAEEVVTDKRSILLVDDDEEVLRYLWSLLEAKFLVYRAGNGETGYQLAMEKVPDLVVSDVNMQGMSGVELCTAIKKSPVLAHIPVILLTGETATEKKLKGIEGGADDYITKPFDTDILLARIETILKNRNLLQQYFFDNITLRQTSVKVPAEYQEFLRKCIQVVENNIDQEDFTIKKFSQAMGMSRSSLYEKVKSISGQSLNSFIRSIRLRRAAVLMVKENMNVNQAAFQVGIADARYFREQFAKLFGINPSEYIKKYRDSFSQDFNVIRTD